jgi:hypothetical protein
MYTGDSVPLAIDGLLTKSGDGTREDWYCAVRETEVEMEQTVARDLLLYFWFFHLRNRPGPGSMP